MLQSLKVGFFRRFYRFTNWRAWRADNVFDSPGCLELPTQTGTIRAHLYRGSAAAELPLIVYLHGGGWVIGDLQTHHAYCTALCAATGASVIAVDYRLAPEAVFPAAQDDTLAAAQYIAEHLADFGPGDGAMVLAGDSAGGHLSLCTALAAPDTLKSKLVGLLLTYPVVDHYTVPYASYEECASGQALTRDLMCWFWDTYLGGADPAAPDTQRAFPIRSAELAALPPAMLCTAGRDPLRDEGIAMRDALLAVGVSVDYRHYPDSEHGFACSMGETPDYRAWLECGETWLRSLSARSSGATQPD